MLKDFNLDANADNEDELGLPGLRFVGIRFQFESCNVFCCLLDSCSLSFRRKLKYHLNPKCHRLEIRSKRSKIQLNSYS